MREANVTFIFTPEDDLKRYLEKALADLKQVKFLYPADEREETLIELCREANIIIGWRASDKLIEKSEKLSLYIFPGAGAHSVVEIFRKLDRDPMPVLINGHGNSYFTAQGTVGLLLALTNKIIPHHNWMIEGKWRTGDEDAITIPLKNRHAGFLGYGAVNSKAHKFLAGFDLEFSALRRDWDKLSEPIPTALTKYDDTELHAFLERIDTLVIAVPVTSKTEGLIGEAQLKLLGKDSLLVNIARGKVVDELSLYTALKNGTIAGAALDVWYDYKPEPDEQSRKYPYSHPFHELDNVVMSPHRAASPFNDLERWQEVIENIRRYAEGRDDFVNVVDLETGY
ncbi:MAG: hypothetical protein GY839_04050 [candidate division Zixibacteria bacterium]|nr:hypothetical protein [candidate division Zixibacteria bacterium]